VLYSYSYCTHTLYSYCRYLNDGFGNGNIVSGWNSVYALDPLNGTDGKLTPAQKALIIGGEVSLWGEEINQDNLQQKAWPRACAFAERMWSSEEFTKGISSSTAPALAALVGPRLVRMYCKIRRRGIKASPLSPGSCHEVYVPP
jgi:hexosaminidase